MDKALYLTDNRGHCFFSVGLISVLYTGFLNLFSGQQSKGEFRNSPVSKNLTRHSQRSRSHARIVFFMIGAIRDANRYGLYIFKRNLDNVVFLYVFILKAVECDLNVVSQIFVYRDGDGVVFVFVFFACIIRCPERLLIFPVER